MVAVLVFRSLPAQKVPSQSKPGEKAHSFQEGLRDYLEDLKNGLVFVQNPTILSLIVPLVGLNLLYAMMVVNLPAFSSEVFGSAIGYGLTLTLFAAGSMSGAAVSSRLMKRFEVGKILPALFLYGGISWALMAVLVVRLPVMGSVLIVAASSALGVINLIFGTIFQQLPPRQMIGRVNTVNLSLMSVASLAGSLLGGAVVQRSTVVFPFLVCGLGYLVIAAAMGANRQIRALPKVSDLREQTLSG